MEFGYTSSTYHSREQQLIYVVLQWRRVLATETETRRSRLACNCCLLHDTDLANFTWPDSPARSTVSFIVQSFVRSLARSLVRSLASPSERATARQAGRQAAWQDLIKAAAPIRLDKLDLANRAGQKGRCQHDSRDLRSTNVKLWKSTEANHFARHAFVRWLYSLTMTSVEELR